MKKFKVYPQVVTASKAITCTSLEEQARDIVIKTIEERIEEAGEGLGFIDGDTFAFAQDEVVYTGSLSEIVQAVESELNDYPDSDTDDLRDVIFDYMRMLYDMGDIVDLFKEHGKLNQMPSWYFD